MHRLNFWLASTLLFVNPAPSFPAGSLRAQSRPDEPRGFRRRSICYAHRPLRTVVRRFRSARLLGGATRVRLQNGRVPGQGRPNAPGAPSRFQSLVPVPGGSDGVGRGGRVRSGLDAGVRPVHEALVAAVSAQFLKFEQSNPICIERKSLPVLMNCGICLCQYRSCLLIRMILRLEGAIRQVSARQFSYNPFWCQIERLSSHEK